MFDIKSAVAESPFASDGIRTAWPLSRRWEFGLVAGIAGVQVAILLLMIVLDGLPLVLGERIKLNVVPVDPRDLFRGDYVVLNYDFTRVEPRQIEGLALPENNWDWYSDVSGRDVYVSLKHEGDHAEVAGISVNRPVGGNYLRGRLQSPYRIDCGIEAYYVQEGEGRRLENLIRSRSIQAEVAVWQGQAKLVRLVE
jgi:uncharacterized membrane-anchored protein